jgi:hypothetical protein
MELTSFISISQTDGSELENIVQRNTEWIRLTYGLLYYYGVMEALLIKEKIEEFTSEKIEFPEFIKVMSFACDFYGQVCSTSYGYKDDRVFDAKKVVEEHRMRPEVDYYPFTKFQKRRKCILRWLMLLMLSVLMCTPYSGMVRQVGLIIRLRV